MNGVEDYDRAVGEDTDQYVGSARSTMSPLLCMIQFIFVGVLIYSFVLYEIEEVPTG